MSTLTAHAGDPYARARQLDMLVMEDELEEFFIELMEFCQQFGRELRKPDLGTEAVLLCRAYRVAVKEFRRGLQTEEAHKVEITRTLTRGIDLREEVLAIFSRKAA